MAIHKKILRLSPLILFFMIIGGCGNHMDKSDEASIIKRFPRDEQGYPKHNIIVINGKEFSLKALSESPIVDNPDDVIKLSDVKKGDRIDVILPQYLPINLWSIEEKETIDLINYSKIELPVQQAVEGKSVFVQAFSFIMDDTSVLFKWSNVRENGKSFSEKETDYLLEIKLD